MGVNLSSVLAPLSSHGVPSVTGTNIKVASRQGCTSGLAGPELKTVRIPIDSSVLFLSDFRDFSDFGYNFRRIPKLYYL